MTAYGLRLLGSGMLLLWGMLALAQAPPEPETDSTPLSLHECVTLALTYQADILTGKNSVVAAKARTIQSQSNYYPQVSVQSAKDLVKTSKNQLNNSDGTPTLTVTQNIYDGGLREAANLTAKYAVQQADATLRRTQQTVTSSVTKAYLSLLRAQALAKVTTQQVSYLEGQLQQVQARIDAGDAAAVDALPLKAQLANARVDALAAQNNIRTASVQLQQTMGLTPDEHFAVQDIQVFAKTEVAAYHELLTAALAQRPEVQQSQAGIGSAKSGVKTAKINLYPRPVVSGQLSQLLGNSSSNTSPHTYNLTVGIAYDLFNGRQNQAAYEEAQANLASAEVRAAQLSKDITADVQTAYLALTNARERADASQLSVEAAQVNFTAQQERYQQGLAIPLDLLNAQLNVTTAQSNAVQAQYDYLTALAQLHYVLGKEGEVTWE